MSKPTNWLPFSILWRLEKVWPNKQSWDKRTMPSKTFGLSKTLPSHKWVAESESEHQNVESESVKSRARLPRALSSLRYKTAHFSPNTLLLTFTLDPSCTQLICKIGDTPMDFDPPKWAQLVGLGLFIISWAFVDIHRTVCVESLALWKKCITIGVKSAMPMAEIVSARRKYAASNVKAQRKNSF